MKLPFSAVIAALMCSVTSPFTNRLDNHVQGAVYAKPVPKSDSVPDKSTVKSQRIAKAKRKAKRGY